MLNSWSGVQALRWGQICWKCIDLVKYFSKLHIHWRKSHALLLCSAVKLWNSLLGPLDRVWGFLSWGGGIINMTIYGIYSFINRNCYLSSINISYFILTFCALWKWKCEYDNERPAVFFFITERFFIYNLLQYDNYINLINHI